MFGVLNNWQTVTLTGILIGATAPTVVSVDPAKAALLVTKDAFPYRLTLAIAAEAETTDVEIMEISAANGTTGVLTISARGCDGTIAQGFPAGSKIRCDITEGLIDEMQAAIAAVEQVAASGQCYANENFYD